MTQAADALRAPGLGRFAPILSYRSASTVAVIFREQ